MRNRLERMASAPALGAAIACAAFIGLTIWWVLYDKALPGGGDPGIHLFQASSAADRIEGLDVGGLIDLGPVGGEFFYPPLVHVIGALPAVLGLAIQDWGTVAINLVFVPILALGVYLVGKRVYGPRAGLLAVVFALGTPMVLSLFHVFVLDAPLAAMIAVAVAALVYSDRFERRRESLIAGVLIGLALLIKPAAPLYLVGPLAVMLIAGGWRRWRNIALATLAALIIAGPYYLIHLNEILDLGEQSTIGPEIGATGEAFDRDARISYDNLSWYGWAAINQVWFVPLLALFAVGLVAAARDLRRRPQLAELLAGVVVTYLALALVLSMRDARYILPLVVYIAVISTGWIATASRAALRTIGVAVLGVAVAANVAAAAFDTPDLRRLFPGTTYELDNDPGTLTFLDDRGYFVGAPRPDDLWPRLFKAAEREGLETARLEIHTTGLWGADPIVFDVVAREYGLREADVLRAGVQRPDLIVDTWFEGSSFPGQDALRPACSVTEEGVGFNGEPLRIVVAVRRLQPDDSYLPWCEF